jgi:hypothetical protein
MERKFGTVFLICLILEVTLCAPVAELEFGQSLEEVSAENLLTLRFLKKLRQL